jgi:hypothetical protein
MANLTLASRDPVILTRMDTDIRIRIHTRMDIRILLIKRPLNILSNLTNLMSIMGITVSKTVSLDVASPSVI